MFTRSNDSSRSLCSLLLLSLLLLGAGCAEQLPECSAEVASCEPTGGAALAAAPALAPRAAPLEAEGEPAAPASAPGPAPSTGLGPEAAPAPEPPPAVERGASGGLSLRRLALALGVEAREPIDVGTRFDPESERIYAFLDLRNRSDEAQAVQVVFRGPGGRGAGFVQLEIPPSTPRFRTWAFTRHARVEGEWEAIVRTEDGEVIGRAPFRIEG